MAKIFLPRRHKDTKKNRREEKKVFFATKAQSHKEIAEEAGRRVFIELPYGFNILASFRLFGKKKHCALVPLWLLLFSGEYFTFAAE